MDVTARATYSGSWWEIEVPEMSGLTARARRLDQVAAAVAIAVAETSGSAAADVQVTVIPVLERETDRDAYVAARDARDRTETDIYAELAKLYETVIEKGHDPDRARELTEEALQRVIPALAKHQVETLTERIPAMIGDHRRSGWVSRGGCGTSGGMPWTASTPSTCARKSSAGHST